MIETIIYNRQDLTIQECNGEITSEELLDTAQSFFGIAHTPYIIWDLASAHMTNISPHAFKQLIDIWQKQGYSSGSCKTAIVAPESLEHSFSSIFNTLIESCRVPLITRVFGSLDLAKQWLFSET